jgi:hypothetical protein
MVDQIESIKIHPFRNKVTFLSNFLKLREAAEKSLPFSIGEKRLSKLTFAGTIPLQSLVQYLIRGKRTKVPLPKVTGKSFPTERNYIQMASGCQGKTHSSVGPLFAQRGDTIITFRAFSGSPTYSRILPSRQVIRSQGFVDDAS